MPSLVRYRPVVGANIIKTITGRKRFRVTFLLQRTNSVTNNCSVCQSVAELAFHVNP